MVTMKVDVDTVAADWTCLVVSLMEFTVEADGFIVIVWISKRKYENSYAERI